MIDLDSHRFSETLTQYILIEMEGKYNISVVWMNPIDRAIGKSFGIYVNSTIMGTATSIDTLLTPNLLTVSLYISYGKMNLSIAMLPGAVLSGGGINIMEVSVQQVLSTSEKEAVINGLLDFIITNEAATSINKLPGSRIIVSCVADFMKIFDRLQFYYYHHQNLTYYSTMLLTVVNSVMS